MEKFANLLKTLGEPIRLRILRLLLAAQRELCVCEFVDALEVPQYNVSKHLHALRGAGLLTLRKEGRWVYFSLAQKTSFQKSLLKALSGLSDEILDQDRKELQKRLALRVKDKCLLGIQKKKLLVAGLGAQLE